MRRILLAPTMVALALLPGCPGDLGDGKKDTRGSGIKYDSGYGGTKDGSGSKDSAKDSIAGAADSALVDQPPGCPKVPPCNWCNGKAVKNSKGCIVGFKCANGVDPCKTQPCKSGSCPKGKYCGKDKLCWPYKDSGVTTPDKSSGPLCLNSKCTAVPGKSCTCNWSCTDGTKYSATCKGSGSGYSCTCYKNSAKTKTCSLSATCYMSYVAKCCGWSFL